MKSPMANEPNTDDVLDRQPRAFVVMPFGQTEQEQDMYDAVYDFVKAKLEAETFKVLRADEIPGSSSIMSQVIQHIDESDLVVVDLTGSNPNVFYELSLAHSLDKPVLLLTQDDAGDLPFDIGAYRVYEYTNSVGGTSKLERALRINARALLAGDPIFGNPVSDYFQRGIKMYTSAETPSYDSPKLGIYDYFADLEDSQGSMNSLMLELSSVQERITIASRESLVRIQQTGSTQKRIILFRQLAKVLNEAATDIIDLNEQYQGALDKHEIGLEAVMRQVLLEVEDNRQPFEKLIGTLGTIEENLRAARASLYELADTLDGMPSVEGNLNLANARVKNAVTETAETLGRNQTIVSRALKIGRARIANG